MHDKANEACLFGRDFFDVACFIIIELSLFTVLLVGNLSFLSERSEI